ncbi:type II toxin-antitoxin system VapC family toxin [Deinococcus malanensis]|uniref:type II toxin-antitoxin system VapC family toxin n=1 Tax=Deinococcus malanensis TaxID=1706855 RepID=UPI0036361251
MSSVSLDTNVLLALWNAEVTASRLAAALDRLARSGRLLVCGAVYAELYGMRPDLDALLRTYGVVADPEMSLMAWQRAGQAHAAYSVRRRAAGVECCVAS